LIETGARGAERESGAVGDGLVNLDHRQAVPADRVTQGRAQRSIARRLTDDRQVRARFSLCVRQIPTQLPRADVVPAVQHGDMRRVLVVALLEGAGDRHGRKLGRVERARARAAREIERVLVAQLVVEKLGVQTAQGEAMPLRRRELELRGE